MIFNVQDDVFFLFKNNIWRSSTLYINICPCNVFLSGLQHAGGHLKQLQKAMKNPTANVSVIFGEAAKRAKRSVGLSNNNALAGVVHPNLAEQGALTSKVFSHLYLKNIT